MVLGLKARTYVPKVNSSYFLSSVQLVRGGAWCDLGSQKDRRHSRHSQAVLKFLSPIWRLKFFNFERFVS